MRSRHSIEDDYFIHSSFNSLPTERQQRIMLELLLDIREMLSAMQAKKRRKK